MIFYRYLTVDSNENVCYLFQWYLDDLTNTLAENLQWYDCL
jgi:hypothetical protein